MISFKDMKWRWLLLSLALSVLIAITSIIVIPIVGAAWFWLGPLSWRSAGSALSLIAYLLLAFIIDAPPAWVIYKHFKRRDLSIAILFIIPLLACFLGLVYGIGAIFAKLHWY